MVDQEYVSALVVFGKASPINLQMLKARVIDLFECITLNQGRDLTQITLPGQVLQFTRVDSGMVQTEFAAVQQALAIIAGQPTIIRQTTPVFW
jgi:hypothetical protein